MADSADKSRDHLDDRVEHPSSSDCGAARQSGPPAVAPEAGADPASRPERAAQPSRPVLPQRSSDETEVGWGDRPAGYDDDWYLAERPPHHGD